MKSFRFADATFKSLGRVDIPLATPTGVGNIYVPMDVVSADVPGLLGLDILDKYKMTHDTVCKRLVKKTVLSSTDEYVMDLEDWSVPLVRFDGHCYPDIAVTTDVMFSRSTLEKLHRQFVHPSADKLYKLLKKARPEDIKPDTWELLEDITRRCDTCQRIQSAPVRFRVSLGAEEFRFNEDVYLSLIHI